MSSVCDLLCLFTCVYLYWKHLAVPIVCVMRLLICMLFRHRRNRTWMKSYAI